jgi:small subunit ribosomal protein S21
VGLRMRIFEREPIGVALRRFKKLVERSGIKGELRARQYYEKPSEARRRKELRRANAIRKANRKPARR